ncbi:MAG: hypothetical protein OXH19_11730 [Chloroflexi bacterium]|nr:hypothetical protein [Chloroflexota bacterium]MCY3587415.1 hypothetical protein [Chloroflexota bacterium]MCY3685444.1 hypothetical protein [Chloroflexota bacterium]MDE2708346.1 hypothetical protein [Chloroflexota bacterium]
MVNRLVRSGLTAVALTAGTLPAWGQVTLEQQDQVPSEAVERVREIIDNLPDDDEWSDNRSVFQRKAVAVLRAIELTTGVSVDWSRVDLASSKVPVREFPFVSGTVAEALGVYGEWTGLFVVESPLGKMFALNPDIYESGRTFRRAVLQGSQRSRSLLAMTEDGRWAPVITTSIEIEDEQEIQIEALLEHVDEEHLSAASDFLLHLDVGDVVDFTGSLVDGRKLPFGLAQYTGGGLDFRGPTHPEGQRLAKTFTFVSVAAMQMLLGHSI